MEQFQTRTRESLWLHHHHPRYVRLKDLLGPGRRTRPRLRVLLVTYLLFPLLPYEDRVVRSEKNDERKSERMRVRGISIRVLSYPFLGLAQAPGPRRPLCFQSRPQVVDGGAQAASPVRDCVRIG